jgi:hypothetical protein
MLVKVTIDGVGIWDLAIIYAEIIVENLAI